VNTKQKILVSTIILVHLFALFLTPWLHVHPDENHEHVEGKVGHAHISTIVSDIDHHDHEPSAERVPESSQEIWHTVPLQSVTVGYYTAVSKFRFNKPVQAIPFADFWDTGITLSSLIPSQYKFLSSDDIPIFILSNRLLSVIDLPPPSV